MIENDRETGEHVVWRVVDDEALILDLSTGYYFSLNPVATDVWSRLRRGDDVTQIVDALAGKYEMDRAVIAADVADLLADLRAAGLLDTEPGSATSEGQSDG